MCFTSVYAAEKDRLAVMDVTDETGMLDEKTIITVTDYIFTKFQGTGLFWMIPKSDRDTALDKAIEETKLNSRKECVDEKCQLSLVAELQANFLINTKIKKLYEGTCNITISKFDVEKRAGVFSWDSKFDCSEKGVFETIDRFDFGGVKKAVDALVKFVSTPSGAEVFVNNKLICQTPCSKMIPTGIHTIVIKKENLAPKKKVFDIKKDQVIEAELEPKVESGFGWLKVTGNYGVELTIDDESVGRIPIDNMKISSGYHTIDHTNLCYNDYDEKIYIKANEKKELAIVLTKRETEITVTAEDKDGNEIEANVFVDGKEYGISPGKFRVPVCSKELILKSRKGQFKTAIDLDESGLNEIKAVIKKAGRWSLVARKKYTWFDAKRHCEKLNESGSSNWQLPSVDELKALFNSSESIDVDGYVFWSSTYDITTGLMNAWFVGGGNYGVRFKTTKLNVICVH